MPILSVEVESLWFWLLCEIETFMHEILRRQNEQSSQVMHTIVGLQYIL